MSGSAFVLVVAAAVAHAIWNLHAKRAASGGSVFLWLCTVLGCVVYAPLGLWQLTTATVTLTVVEGGFIVGSVMLHTLYFGVLQRAYSVGDLSVVYPVARGLGPVLVIGGAVLLLDERPSVRALLGALVVCTAIASLGFTSVTGSRRDREATRTLGYAGLTGGTIAAYTLWDAYAVTTLAIPPLVLIWLASVIRLTILTPVMWRRRAAIHHVWDQHRVSVVAVATLSPFAYILVLHAFILAPVSHVAPLREVSIVIGTALGARLLREARGPQRTAAAVAVLIGVALVLSG